MQEEGAPFPTRSPNCASYSEGSNMERAWALARTVFNLKPVKRGRDMGSIVIGLFHQQAPSDQSGGAGQNECHRSRSAVLGNRDAVVGSHCGNAASRLSKHVLHKRTLCNNCTSTHRDSKKFSRMGSGHVPPSEHFCLGCWPRRGKANLQGISRRSERVRYRGCLQARRFCLVERCARGIRFQR